MAHSYGVHDYYACPSCGHISGHWLWLVVDTSERPDLDRRIAGGTIHVINCSNCGHELSRHDLPLLVYPDKESLPVLFSPAKESTREENEELAELFLRHLRIRLGSEWPVEHRATYHVIARQLLPQVLSGEVGLVGATATFPPSFWEGPLPEPAEDKGIDLQNYLRAVGELITMHETAETAIREFGESGRESPLYPMTMGHLGRDYLLRYRASGEMADLKRSLELLRESVKTTGEEAVEWPDRISMLAAAYHARYERTGQIDDLQAAQALFEAAAKSAPPGSTARPSFLGNLGATLRMMYVLTDQSETLDRAIAILEESVELTPATASQRPARLNNLATCLLDRYKLHHRPADRDRAKSALVEAIDQTPPDSPDLAARLMNLATVWLTEYDQFGDKAALDRAIDRFQEAVNMTLPDDPNRPGRIQNLAAAIKRRHDRLDLQDDLDRATELFEMAARTGLDVAPDDSLLSARNWGNWAFVRRSWKEATEAFALASEAGEQLVRTQLIRGDKELWLSQTQGLAGRAAYARAKEGDALGAALILEQGRARLLSEVLERDHASLEQVKTIDPDIYKRYRGAVARLRAAGPGGGDEMGLTAGVTLPDQASRRATIIQARAAVESAIEQIRAIPGYEDFLGRPTLQDLVTAVGSGEALVYLATTVAGSLALVIRQATGKGALEAEAIWSGEVTVMTLNRLLVDQEENEFKGGYLPGQMGNRAWLDEALDTVLPLLGEQLIGPIAACLRGSSVSALTLLPTGVLSLFPLHAALYPVEGQTVCLLDEWPVAYAPVARVVSIGRSRLAQQHGPVPVLAGVGNPLPHPKPLYFARAELERVATFFAEESSRPLYGKQATKEDLLAKLPGATYVHLACHGLYDADQPMNSHVQFSNKEKLTLREILEQGRFQESHLVVLSACQTGITDIRRLPDEAIGLPSGLLQAGALGVVASLWPVNDLATALLMERFYRLHLEGDPSRDLASLPPAQALRQAQLWLREVSRPDVVRRLHEIQQVWRKRRDEDELAYEQWSILRQGKSAVRRMGDPPFSSPYYWAAFQAVGAVL